MDEGMLRFQTNLTKSFKKEMQDFLLNLINKNQDIIVGGFS